MSSVDVKFLDKILTQIVRKFNNSKKEADNIVERIREEYNSTGEELEKINSRVGEIARELNELRHEECSPGQEIGRIGLDPPVCSSEDMLQTYNRALELKAKYSQLKNQEKYLIQERDRLANRQKKLLEVVAQAEDLSIQITDAINCLVNNLNGVYKLINELQSKDDVVKAIIRAQEEERKSIAREIHDGPAQAISNVVIRAEICRHLGSGNENLIEELDGLKGTANSSLEDIRRIILNLRPMHLDDLGLVYAIKKYCEEFEKQTGIKVVLECSGDERRFEETTEISIFRVIQEILNNARKHSKADKIIIQINITPLNISVKITDNGIGFDPDKVDYTKHFGIKGICERVNLLEGTVEIKSKINKGTAIFIEIPVK